MVNVHSAGVTCVVKGQPLHSFTPAIQWTLSYHITAVKCTVVDAVGIHQASTRLASNTAVVSRVACQAILDMKLERGVQGMYNILLDINIPCYTYTSPAYIYLPVK
jgi:hypothetical protein